MILHLVLFFVFMTSSETQSFIEFEDPVFQPELDFNTMAYFGVSKRYNCQKGFKITIANEKYISLGSLRKTFKKRSAKLCKVQKENSGELMALKIVQNDATAIQEAEIQMMLQDVEQVAKLHLWSVMGSHRVMVVEFVEKVRWPKHDIRKIWRKILKAVAAIHEKGVLHLDLHVGNLLLNKDGDIKIIDFGQSVLAQAINVTSFCISKPKHPVTYASPEYLLKCKIERIERDWPREFPDLRDDLQSHSLRGSIMAKKVLKDYDLRYKIGQPSDVWSVCCVLYELIYGEQPYDYLLHNTYAGRNIELDDDGMTHTEKVEMLMEKNAQFVFPSYPKDHVLRETLIKCLVHEPNNRPTISEMLEMLENQQHKETKKNLEKNAIQKHEL